MILERAAEASSIRIKDLDLGQFFRYICKGRIHKTRTDRIIFLTDEVAHQLKSWLDYKYRTRRICHKGEQDEKRLQNTEALQRKTQKN